MAPESHSYNEPAAAARARSVKQLERTLDRFKSVQSIRYRSAHRITRSEQLIASSRKIKSAAEHCANKELDVSYRLYEETLELWERLGNAQQAKPLLQRNLAWLGLAAGNPAEAALLREKANKCADPSDDFETCAAGGSDGFFTLLGLV